MLPEDSLQTEDNKMGRIFVVGDKQGTGVQVEATAGSLRAAGVASRMSMELKSLCSKRKNHPTT